MSVNVTVTIIMGAKEERVLTLSEHTTYEELLKSLKINPEMVLVFQNDMPRPVDDEVMPGNVKILRVVSGG